MNTADPPSAETPTEEIQPDEPETQHLSLSTVNDVADLATQLRACQERSARVEQLLSKKNIKLQEMEETETKLKRLLSMAKRSIDNSKHEIAEKEETIQKLRDELAKTQQIRHSWYVDRSTRDPKKVLVKVAHGDLLWCLVEYLNEEELDDSKELAWHCFHNEEELQTYANRASGEPLTLPDVSLTPFEVERVEKRLKKEIDRVQEEFRRYRIRSEITRKQKDAEIRKMSANVVAKQTEQISETDLTKELHSSKAQIRRLSKAQAEAEERESDWRRKFEKLMKDYEKLSGTMGETFLAMEWRERYEQSIREKEELQKQLEEFKLLNESGDNDLRQGFPQYWKRSSKEKDSNDTSSHFNENGGGSSNASRTNSFKEVRVRRMSIESNSSLSGFETPNATKTNEYLKNIIFKYITSDKEEAKEHMEKAIATVLNFSQAEIATLQEKRKQQSWFW